MKYLLPLATLLVVFGCAKEKTAEAPPATTTTAETTTTAAETQPPPAAPQTAITLPAGAPIPATGVLLWLSADDAVAKDGKLQAWQNAGVPNVTAKALHDDRLPAVVPNAINGHAAVRFDGTDQQLMTNISIAPARMPEGTVVSVFRSATSDASPLRKLYGDDNGGYDRAAGLDDRASGKNYTVFTGNGVEGYFQLVANTTYVLVDEYSPNEFSGWVNGAPAITKAAAAWGATPDDALPNLYLGGTGTVYGEFWNGDLAEIIVYARKLSDAERAQVVDYLAKKYGVTLQPSS
jgi:hypothetical protein